MSYLSIFTSIQRPHRKLQTETSQKLYKHASEYKKISHYAKLQGHGKMLAFQHSKVLPKNIVYDKQSLYLEVLSLKIQLNQMIDENLKLKTKVTSLEKEIEKKNRKKIFSEKEEAIRYKNDPLDHNENKMIQSLKVKLKQARRKMDVCESQNLKLKKMLKISKLHEAEVQNSVLLEENLKLSQNIEELLRKVETCSLLEQKNRHLEKNQKSFISQLKAFEKDIVTLQSYIQTLQLEQKYQLTSTTMKDKRQLSRKTLSKSKIQSLAKNIAEIKKYENITKANGFRINKREQKVGKHIQILLPLRKQPIHTSFNSPRKQQPNRSQSVKTQEKGASDLHHQSNRFIDSRKKVHKELKSDFSQSNIQKNRKKSEFVKNDYSSVTIDEPSKNAVQNRLQGTMHSKALSEPQSPKLHSKHAFKSNKKLLKDIQQLLSYRMMAQRYTYNELINDIQQSQTKQFTYIDLCHMFVNEPFYLTVDYCRYLLNFIFQKEKPSHNDIVGSIILIAKLRKILLDFELKNEEEENKILQNCTNKVTKYSKELKKQFTSINSSSSSISIIQLQRVLPNYEFSTDEITLIIGELAICSSDLLHLNYDVIFQRFDLDQLSADEEGNVIEQMQNDDSFIAKSKKVDQKHKKEQKDNNQKQVSDSNKKIGQSKKN